MQKRKASFPKTKTIVVCYRKEMNINAFYIFTFVFFFVVARNNNGFNTPVDQRFCQVVRANAAPFLWGIEVLMKNQDFHGAKKTIRLVEEIGVDWFLFGVF